MSKDVNDSQTIDILSGQERFLTHEEIKALAKKNRLSMARIAEVLKIRPEYLSRLIADPDKRKDAPQWEYALRYLLDK